jgi:hypothetical protein
MKCEIIRDLLPSYVEGLTSDESNKEIEKHLKDCIECSNIHNEMKSEVKVESLACDSDRIKLFKKLNKRVVKAVGLTIVVCAVIVGVYMFFYGVGWEVNSNDMNIEYSYEDYSIDFEFELTDGKALNAWTDYDLEKNAYIIKFTECYVGRLDDREKYPNRFSYGINFVTAEEIIIDNDLINKPELMYKIDESGKGIDEYKDRIIILEFKNETITYRVGDIINE